MIIRKHIIKKLEQPVPFPLEKLIPHSLYDYYNDCMGAFDEGVGEETFNNGKFQQLPDFKNLKKELYALLNKKLITYRILRDIIKKITDCFNYGSESFSLTEAPVIVIKKRYADALATINVFKTKEDFLDEYHKNLKEIKPFKFGSEDLFNKKTFSNVIGEKLKTPTLFNIGSIDISLKNEDKYLYRKIQAKRIEEADEFRQYLKKMEPIDELIFSRSVPCRDKKTAALLAQFDQSTNYLRKKNNEFSESIQLIGSINEQLLFLKKKLNVNFHFTFFTFQTIRWQVHKAIGIGETDKFHPATRIFRICLISISNRKDNILPCEVCLGLKDEVLKKEINFRKETNDLILIEDLSNEEAWDQCVI